MAASAGDGSEGSGAAAAASVGEPGSGSDCAKGEVLVDAAAEEVGEAALPPDGESSGRSRMTVMR